MSYLGWITDKDLAEAVRVVVVKAQKARSNANIHRNVIDPFSLPYEIAGLGIASAEEWFESEQKRQAQKTIANCYGMFHQAVLGKVNGWVDLEVGGIVDLKSVNAKIIAEVKNKHNTVTGSKLVDVYKQIENLVMPKNSNMHGYTGYLVQIIGKTPERYDIPFTPSDPTKKNRMPENKLIRVIDGVSFYHLVTGSESALSDLYNVLPDVIEDVSGVSISRDDRKQMRLLFDRAMPA